MRASRMTVVVVVVVLTMFVVMGGCGGSVRPVSAAAPGDLEGDWRWTACANLSSGHAVPFDCPGRPGVLAHLWRVIRLHASTCQWGLWNEGESPSYEPCSLQQGSFCANPSHLLEMCVPMKIASGKLYRCLGDTLCEEYERIASAPMGAGPPRR